MRLPQLRPLIWISGAKRDYEQFPVELRHDLGYQLYLAQADEPVPDEKPLSKGALKGLGIRELVADQDGDTFRVVYTVKLRAAVYVLHAFKKKSKRGISTPQHEIDVIRMRYTIAIRLDDSLSPL